MASHPGRSQPSGLQDVGTDVLDLLATCTGELAQQRQELVLTLHQRLLELAPSVIRTVASGRPMCRRLVSAVLYASGAGTGFPPDDAAAVVRRAGMDNYREGFSTAEYSAVTHAMLHAVRGVYTGEWASALSSAWVEYLLWFRSELLAGAEAQEVLAAAEAARSGAPENALADGWDQAPRASSRPGGRNGRDRAAGPPSLPRSAILDDDLDDDLDDEDEPGFTGLMSSMTLDSRRDKRAR
ncbi:MAG TPA: hypothetical protein VI248_17505 [Kineosporiaceae bacterium]